MKWIVLAAVLVLLVLVWAIWRREKCKRKVRRMDPEEKCSKLNDLAEPFGFIYDPGQEVFISRVDAWQRREGYEALFDRLAVKFNMVMDAFPVYFDYRDKTWLIEFWKGQYGITTGAEVGIYGENKRGMPENPEDVFYECVSKEEELPINMKLYKNGKMVYQRIENHWWLTVFVPREFSYP